MFPNLRGLEMRHPTIEDIPQIVAFANQCAQMDMGIEQVNTVEQLSAFWQDEQLHPERDILLVVDAHGNMVATLAALIAPPYTYVYQELNIHPIYRGRGLEEFLLERAENHAKLALEYADASTTVMMIHGVHSQRRWLRDLLEKHAYTIVQTITRLALRLDEMRPLPAFPPTIEFRPYTDQDAGALSTTLREINQDIGAANPPSFEALMLHPFFDPLYVTVAWEGKAIAAVSVLFPQTEDDSEAGQVAYVGVRRAWRGMNLGQACLNIGLRTLQAHTSHKRAIVLVSRPPQVAYFQKIGFTIEQETLIYQKPVT